MSYSYLAYMNYRDKASMTIREYQDFLGSNDLIPKSFLDKLPYILFTIEAIDPEILAKDEYITTASNLQKELAQKFNSVGVGSFLYFEKSGNALPRGAKGLGKWGCLEVVSETTKSWVCKQVDKPFGKYSSRKFKINKKTLQFKDLYWSDNWATVVGWKEAYYRAFRDQHLHPMLSMVREMPPEYFHGLLMKLDDDEKERLGLNG